MPKAKVFLTIDVETCESYSSDGRPIKLLPVEKTIYCEKNGKEYGIRMIMDILDNYGLKGIFFVESEARHYLGDDQIRKIVSIIKERGHDVQLHVHPLFCFFKDGSHCHIEKNNTLRNYSRDEQSRIIGQGKQFLESCGVNEISAFRSGGFSINMDTFRALEENGIPFSSSYNVSYLKKCRLEENDDKFNIPFLVGKVIEFPITNIKQNFPFRGYKPFQVCAISSAEFKKALNFYLINRLQAITIVTHSFEFMKRSRNKEGKFYAPDKSIIGRFKNLCEYLSLNKNSIEVMTFTELRERNIAEEFLSQDKNIIYESSLIDVIIRYFRQVLGL